MNPEVLRMSEDSVLDKRLFPTGRRYSRFKKRNISGIVQPPGFIYLILYFVISYDKYFSYSRPTPFLRHCLVAEVSESNLNVGLV